jgi:hypothetical protein
MTELSYCIRIVNGHFRWGSFSWNHTMTIAYIASERARVQEHTTQEDGWDIEKHS